MPCAFISGITGQFFRQFALTIAVSTVISAFNSLTLSPALAAILLQPQAQRTRRDDLALAGWLARTSAARLVLPACFNCGIRGRTARRGVTTPVVGCWRWLVLRRLQRCIAASLGYVYGGLLLGRLTAGLGGLLD